MNGIEIVPPADPRYDAKHGTPNWNPFLIPGKRSKVGQPSVYPGEEKQMIQGGYRQPGHAKYDLGLPKELPMAMEYPL
jgi:hypothetical protein